MPTFRDFYTEHIAPEKAAEIFAAIIQPGCSQGMLAAVRRILDDRYNAAAEEGIRAAVFDGSLSLECARDSKSRQMQCLWISKFYDQLYRLLRKGGDVM